jgi:hypothetical protein
MKVFLNKKTAFIFILYQSLPDNPTVAGEIFSARSMIPISCSTGLPGTASNTSLIVHFIPRD